MFMGYYLAEVATKINFKDCIGMCIPSPSLLTSEVDLFYDYFITCYDKLCVESPNAAIILGGDFNPACNGFQHKRLERHCNLKQIVCTLLETPVHWI